MIQNADVPVDVKVNKARLDLADLNERHPGIAPGLAAFLLEVTSVCLERHHTSPCLVGIHADWEDDREYVTHWPTPGDREHRSYNNTKDATEDGAYCLALAGAEAHLGLVAMSRTGQGTGADWLIGPSTGIVNPEDGELVLEDFYRLEVTGIGDRDDANYIQKRLRAKVEQAKNGASFYPAVASVVVFKSGQVVFKKA